MRFSLLFAFLSALGVADTPGIRANSCLTGRYARAIGANGVLACAIPSGSGNVDSVNGQVGTVVLTTSDVAEGSNLYLTTARVIASVLTGFSAGAGTVSSSDSLLQALNKIVGNLALKAPIANPSFTGTVTLPGAVNGPSELDVNSSGLVELGAGGTGFFDLDPSSASFNGVDVFVFGAHTLFFPGNGGIGGPGDSKPKYLYLDNITASAPVVADADKKLVGQSYPAFLATAVAATAAPSTSSSTCTTGMLAKDTSFLYVCVASNTWKRSALSSW